MSRISGQAKSSHDNDLQSFSDASAALLHALSADPALVERLFAQLPDDAKVDLLRQVILEIGPSARAAVFAGHDPLVGLIGQLGDQRQTGSAQWQLEIKVENIADAP